MRKFYFTIIAVFISLMAFGQHEKCGTMHYHYRRISENPDLKKKMEESEIRTQQWIASQPAVNPKLGLEKRVQQVVTIPVVVHVLWNDPVENISDEQIFSQIEVLNEDFRLQNFDSLEFEHPFWVDAADALIEFCLASRDPDGNPTSGITRTYTDVVSFLADGSEKFSDEGGEDAWDATQYLNIWVCNLEAATPPGLLGYATFPDELADYPEEDGVVIRYQAFGYDGVVEAPNDGGRTATHEVGHWLNLRHIWGDEYCGDDFVDDTEPAEQDNYGCPEFPHNYFNGCGAGENGEMYMNYMDYVDDDCMNMFTYGQTLRMDDALFGPRSGLLTSQGCNDPTSVLNASFENSIDIYPNPGNGIFTIKSTHFNHWIKNIAVYDAVGSKVREYSNIVVASSSIDLTSLSDGIYHVRIDGNDSSIVRKVVLTK
jgi:hypothetical protein